jgi:hypothetical protein
MEYLYSEILDMFQKAETRKDKIAVLKRFEHPTFKKFLDYAFNPEIKFDVEIPEYKSSHDPAGLNVMYLDDELARVYRFIVGHPKRAAGLTPKKQTELLLVILESLHKDEAELYVRMLKKDLKIPFLTKKLLKEVYPDLPFEG